MRRHPERTRNPDPPVTGARASAAAAELSEPSRALAALLGSFQIESAAAAPRPRPEVASVADPARQGARPRRPEAGSAANGPAGPTAGRSGIPLRPEEVIPMDGEPGFADF